MNFENINSLVELYDFTKQNNLEKNFLFKINKSKEIDSLTWGQVDQKVKNVTNFLQEKGIVKGDRILLVSENRP